MEPASLDSYLQGKRYCEIVPLPRSPGGVEGTVGVTILFPLEVQEAERDAIKHTRTLADLSGCSLEEFDRLSPQIRVDERVIQILARCLVQPGNPLVKWATPGTIRSLLTFHQVQALFNVYGEVQRKVSPWISEMTAREVDAVIDALGKDSPDPSLLAYSDIAALRMLARSLASRLRAGRTDSSSPSSP